MWTKLDDGLGSHRKLWRAAKLIKGPDAFARALGAFCVALLHANRYLTDGQVPEDAFEACGVSQAAVQALVEVNLLEVDPGGAGYRIHDFHHYNPTADQVRERQERDRIRKRSRQGYAVTSAQTPGGVQKDSARTPLGFRAESDRIPFDESAGVAVARVPGPTRPDLVPPPTPPRTEGRRRTRAAHLAALRAQGPAAGAWRARCPHTPTCHTPEACRLTTAKGQP